MQASVQMIKMLYQDLSGNPLLDDVRNAGVTLFQGLPMVKHRVTQIAEGHYI